MNEAQILFVAAWVNGTDRSLDDAVAFIAARWGIATTTELAREALEDVGEVVRCVGCEIWMWELDLNELDECVDCTAAGRSISRSHP